VVLLLWLATLVPLLLLVKFNLNIYCLAFVVY
jgi:hypothetical protein